MILLKNTLLLATNAMLIKFAIILLMFQKHFKDTSWPAKIAQRSPNMRQVSYLGTPGIS